MMPESKYSYRPTKEVRSFAEILAHVGDISYILCSNAKGEATPGMAAAKVAAKPGSPSRSAGDQLGAPTAEDFRFENDAVPKPEAGQVLLRTLYLSLDPYMRGRMSDGSSYAAPVAIPGRNGICKQG